MSDNGLRVVEEQSIDNMRGGTQRVIQETTINNLRGSTRRVIVVGGGGGSGLPDQTGHSGEFLTTNGTTASWTAVTKVNTTITLTAAGWSSNTQTVSVTGMTATGVVWVSPDPSDQSAYTSAGILCTAQAAGTLTFTCDTVPSGDIDVNVVML